MIGVDHQAMLVQLRLTAVPDQLDTLLDERARREPNSRETLALLRERGPRRNERHADIGHDVNSSVENTMPPVTWSPYDSPFPLPFRDISKLLRTTEGKGGFERRLAAKDERHLRIADLQRHPSLQAHKTVARLAGCGRGTPCLRPCCPECTGRMRIWFYAEVAQALGIEQTTAQSRSNIITLVHEDWILQRQQIMTFDPKVLIDRVRHQLLRAGGDGAIVIGAVHGEYDKQRQYWQPHLHLIVQDLDAPTISLLRNRHYQRTPLVYRPMVVQPLRDPPRQISYLLKSYWPMRERHARAGYQKSSTFRRIPEPLHSEYLMMQDQFNLLDFVFLLGVRRQGHRLVPLPGPPSV